jgi:hypothetical protein
MKCEGLGRERLWPISVYCLHSLQEGLSGITDVSFRTNGVQTWVLTGYTSKVYKLSPS